MLARATAESAQPFEVSAATGTVPPAASYGWYRQGLPMERDELLKRNVESLIGALKTSIDDSIVPADLSGRLEEIQRILTDAKAGSILKPSPAGAGASWNTGDRPLQTVTPDPYSRRRRGR